ncbi:hypothetical protein LPL18_003470 [Halomonas sp. CUBES01]|uniref:hypothetical protein n=1 Tax=Halomonas sp. CUBES01 TaxID=2897340 RepID=UPI001E3C506B|nr:hypothetical protein [Halomonas sp. CUBES01]MEC4766398.1 hypothetical protein [Halomonas sp. CUBES01]
MPSLPSLKWPISIAICSRLAQSFRVQRTLKTLAKSCSCTTSQLKKRYPSTTCEAEKRYFNEAIPPLDFSLKRRFLAMPMLHEAYGLAKAKPPQAAIQQKHPAAWSGVFLLNDRR